MIYQQSQTIILLDEVFVISKIIRAEVNGVITWSWGRDKGYQPKLKALPDMITRDLKCSNDITGADFENSLYAFSQSEKS